jgi:uncharacterized protein (TIGR01777 family)
MERFEQTTPLPVSADDAFAWHARRGSLERLIPPWRRIRVVESPALADGNRVVFDMRSEPLRCLRRLRRPRRRWIAELCDVRPGIGFRDVQVAGPFARWEHAHAFEPRGEHCLLRDTIDYALPCGALGEAAGRRMVASDLERLFRYRHRTTTDDLSFHRRYRETRRLRVAIAGAGGMVGSQLAALLTGGGHEVVRLVRGRPAKDASEARWEPATGSLEGEVECLDAFVFLAGENIGSFPWTAARKRRLVSSRVDAVEALTATLGRLDRPPRVFVSASGVGYEGEGFLADLARRWEDATRGAEAFGARVAMTRFGVVLSARGGALAQMLPAFRLGGGGPLGSGRQVVSWISLDDTIGAIFHALVDEGVEGPLNVTAPTPVTQRELARTLGRLLHRPSFVRMPALALRLVMGEMADQTLLVDITARPDKLLERGYAFRHPELEAALAHELGLDYQADG